MTPEGLNAQPDDDRESFIFISYAHQDKDEVLEIIGRMQAEGYRIWYNKRTDSSMEWAEHIAERLADCGYFIAFISPEYLASANCLDELNYARDKEKNRLLVYLSNVTLPAGLSMRINRLQATSTGRRNSTNASSRRKDSAAAWHPLPPSRDALPSMCRIPFRNREKRRQTARKDMIPRKDHLLPRTWGQRPKSAGSCCSLYPWLSVSFWLC